MPIPAGARVPLAGVSWPPAGRVRAIHVGRSGVLFGPSGGGRGGLLPVTGGARGLVPGGICVQDVAGLRAVADAASHVGLIDLSAWEGALAHAPRTDLAVRPGTVDVEAVRRMARLCAQVPVGAPGPMDPAPVRRLADPLVRAALAGDQDEVTRHLTALVGAGPGATPTGDDVVIGVLAALDRHAGVRTSAAAGLVRRTLPSLLGRTTAVSRHDLAAAVAGQFAERVHTLLQALGRPGSVPAVVRVARGWGATSGIDLAHGIVATAAVVLGATTADRTPTLTSATP